jgi:NitT/TauT family transport system ATP-binding protein
MVISLNKLLTVEALSKRFDGAPGSVQALKGIDFDLESGETLAILGPTGCGKSSLLFQLAGLERPTSGAVTFEGQRLRSPHRHISLVLQDYGLFPWKTVRANIELGLRIRGEQVEKERFNALLAELGIAEKLDSFPRQLSGGQKQRVALARALILNPTLMLMDEPFAALDTLTRERLQDLVCRLWRRRKFAMVLVTHNIEEAVRLGRRIAIMSHDPGRIVHVIDNLEAMTENQRGSERFTTAMYQVRQKLEVAV